MAQKTKIQCGFGNGLLTKAIFKAYDISMKYFTGFYFILLLIFLLLSGDSAVFADAETISQQHKLSAKKSDKYKKIKDINSQGKRIDPDILNVPNRIHIVYFYANWCGLCSTINSKIERLVKKHKNLCLRKVNIVHEHTPIAEQFGVMAVPDLRGYDKKGKLVVAPTADFDQIESYVEKLIR